MPDLTDILDDLNIDGPRRNPHAPGRAEETPEIFEVMEITDGDMVRMKSLGPANSGATQHLARITTGHQAVAAFLASGMRVADITRLTGYSATTIRTLKRDPLFQELLAEKQEKFERNLFDYQARLDFLAAEASDLLMDRFGTPEERQNIPSEFAYKIFQGSAAAKGHGPITRSHSTSLSGRLSADQVRDLSSRGRLLMQEGIERAREESDPRKQRQLNLGEREVEVSERPQGLLPAGSVVHVDAEGSAPAAEADGEEAAGGTV